MPTLTTTDDDALPDADNNLADNVGKPVTAKDADDDTPTYTLGGSGSDKDMFRLRANGQIEVERQGRCWTTRRRKRYTVTVMADDGYGASNSKASITVTIHVTDLDEGPDDKGQSGLYCGGSATSVDGIRRERPHGCGAHTDGERP